MANMIQLGRLYCDLTTAVGPAVVEQTLVRVGVAEGTVYSVAHPVPEGCDRPTGQVMFHFFFGGVLLIRIGRRELLRHLSFLLMCYSTIRLFSS